jgi:S1-C subfamily serine protease
VPLTVTRGNSTTHATVRAGEVPTNLGLRILADVAGLHVQASGNRLEVSDVTRGSRADHIGITPGDVIVGVGGVEITSIKQLNDEVAKTVEHSAFILDVTHGGTIYELTFPMAM